MLCNLSSSSPMNTTAEVWWFAGGATTPGHFFETFCTIVFIWVSSLRFLHSFFKIRHGFEQIYTCFYVLGFRKILFNLFGTKPYLDLFYMLMMNICFISKNKRWIFMIFEIRVWFQFFSNLFEVFTSIHRLLSLLNLRWWFEAKNEKDLYVYLILFGDSNN